MFVGGSIPPCSPSYAQNMLIFLPHRPEIENSRNQKNNDYKYTKAQVFELAPYHFPIILSEKSLHPKFSESRSKSHFSLEEM